MIGKVRALEFWFYKLEESVVLLQARKGKITHKEQESISYSLKFRLFNDQNSINDKKIKRA